jgi:hypothetical protein
VDRNLALGLSYHIEVAPEPDGFSVTVHLDQSLPSALVGKAGFNLEFLPTSYFGKSYILDTGSGTFPRHPNGPMQKDATGIAQPAPIATGQRIVLSPEDPLTRVTISSDSGPLMFFDGRNKAQNGWFVVRTLISSGRTQNAVVWHIHPNVVSGWTRPPVVACNQVGYTPPRKVAVIESTRSSMPRRPLACFAWRPMASIARLFRAKSNPGANGCAISMRASRFSALHEPGIYAIEYAGHLNAIRILNRCIASMSGRPRSIYLPVQMIVKGAKAAESGMALHTSMTPGKRP